jgi:hypothetical protein
MPLYDMKCGTCGRELIDVFAKVEERQRLCGAPVQAYGGEVPCPGIMERVWMTKPPTVIGDEIDIEIKHGLCNEDGSPRRYTSKSEIAREAKRRGLYSRVEHVGTKSGDRSRHTTRWI